MIVKYTIIDISIENIAKTDALFVLINVSESVLQSIAMIYIHIAYLVFRDFAIFIGLTKQS